MSQRHDRQEAHSTGTASGDQFALLSVNVAAGVRELRDLQEIRECENCVQQGIHAATDG
jgi:hypothetical protein